MHRSLFPLDKFVEDAVDELRGLGGAVALGEFDGFVDGDAGGRVGEADFVGAEAAAQPNPW